MEADDAERYRLSPVRGVLWGVVFSLPLWAVIIALVIIFT